MRFSCGWVIVGAGIAVACGGFGAALPLGLVVAAGGLHRGAGPIAAIAIAAAFRPPTGHPAPAAA